MARAIKHINGSIETGEIDQFNNEIHTGDILLIEETEDNSRLVFLSTHASVHQNEEGQFFCKGGYVGKLIDAAMWDRLTVVGNIDENPELLED